MSQYQSFLYQFCWKYLNIDHRIFNGKTDGFIFVALLPLNFLNKTDFRRAFVFYMGQ